MAQGGYELVDSGHGQRLERVAGISLVRPAAQALWPPAYPPDAWEMVSGRFSRQQKSSEGVWHGALPRHWVLQVSDQVRAQLRPNPFGHLGFFAEHHDLSGVLAGLAGCKRPQVLNLFGYTGVPSLLLAAAGCEVTHVDASRSSNVWGQENAALSGTAGVRWVCEDVTRFVGRLRRRGARFDAVILDPPSFGRGPKNELWKLESHLWPLLQGVAELLVARGPRVVQLTAHSEGLSPLALRHLLAASLPPGEVRAHELVLAATSGRDLAVGSLARWRGE